MFLGIFNIDEHVPIPAVTHRFSSGAAYAPTSVTYSIYEEGNTTGLDEDVDMTPASPFDSIVGAYYARRQLTAAAGFEAGKTYVVIVKATVDSVAAIDMHIFQVRILQTGDAYAVVAHTDYGNAKLVRSTTPANTLAVGATGLVAVPDTQKVDVETIKTRAITCAAGVTVLANLGFAGAPGANNGAPTTNGTKINQTADLTSGQSIACSDKTGFALSATGADLILKSSTFIQAIVAAINEFATYGLTALNTLLVTTGIKLNRPAGAVVNDVANSTTTFKTGLTSSEDDYIKDAYVKFTSGADINQVKKISAYNGTTKFITCAAFTDEPAENDTFVIINE